MDKTEIHEIRDTANFIQEQVLIIRNGTAKLNITGITALVKIEKSTLWLLSLANKPENKSSR